MMPCCAFSMSPPAACRSLRMMFSTSSPTYPASVSVVASTMVKGTESRRASVWARSVLPVPVGPMRRMLDFVSSTSCRPRDCFWISSRL